MDPAFRLMQIFHSMASLILIFEKWFLLIKKNDLKSPLIFVLFLKDKQNKKENPKCDSLFWKRCFAKKPDRVRGQVTYWESTVKTVAPL